MIRRYYATKDNSITNAYQENLTTRGTGSNMGASDVLEVFSIYGQESSTSSELMRTLVQFDTTQIAADRAAGKVPASGSVSWYLKMFNAPHSQTTPSEFDIIVSAISSSWEEGYGMDMDYYDDLTKDGIGSNWINAKQFTAASGILDLTADITLTSVAKGRTRNTNTFKTVVNAAAANPTNTILAAFTGTTAAIVVTITPNDGTNNGSTAVNLTTAELAELINNGTVVGKTVTITDASSFRALQTATGGDTTNLANGGEGHNVTATFDGATGQWLSEGGDYLTDVSSSFTQSFTTGLEDMDLDVTTLVEQWLNSAGNILGSKGNYGFGIQLPSATETTDRSFFTKKFFGRDSEFFFQRPVVEARWDSARQDDRGSFYLSSSLATAEENLNTIYLYNSVRGKLRNIPDVGTGTIGVSLFSSSAGSPTGSTFTLVADEGNVYASNPLVVTGGHVSTGVYTASVAFTGSTDLTTASDVWFKIENTVIDAAASSNQYYTGSIALRTLVANGHNPETAYVLSMPRLRKEYRKNQTHRLDLYAREKNWSPNIYTVAVQSSIPSLIIPSASFQLRRSIDDYVVVPYGTGSTTLAAHTALSYDVSGNYFDLDTTYLETGYLYEIQYSFYDEENGWEEQPYRFKFRVVD
jgi:hypothetical protein